MKQFLRRLQLSTSSSNNDDPLSDRSSRTSRNSESNNNSITTNKSLSSLSGLLTAAKHSITRSGSFKNKKETQDVSSTTSSDISKLISEEPSSSSSMSQYHEMNPDMPRDSPLETAELDTFQLAVAPEIIQTDAFQLAKDQSLFLQDEDLQIRAAMELSVREDPEAAEIEAAKELSQLILQPEPSPSNSTAAELSFRYWKCNALSYEDKVVDGFYDVSGDLTELYPNQLPSLLDLQEISVFDQISFEVVLVDRTTDTHLVRLEQRIIELSSKYKVADGVNRRELVYKIANLVCDQMGGPAFDPEELLGSWRSSSKELILSLGNIVIPLGRLQIGLGRHRALLFKVLADAAGIPCQLLKGKNYMNIDEGALNTVKVDFESEIFIDWTGMGVEASNLMSLGECEYLCQEIYNPITRQTSTSENNMLNDVILKGFDHSTLNEFETQKSDPKEVGLVNVATDSISTEGSSHWRSPSWTEGVGASDSEQKKVRDVSQYMLDAAKDNPTFARKLQEVFIESGVEAPPDLFAEISSVQLQAQITEDLKLLDESRRGKTGKPKSAIMGFGSSPAPASSYSSSSEDRLQRLSSVEGLGERRPLDSSSSNLSPSSTPSSSGSSSAVVQSNSPVIPASVAMSLVQETLTPDIIKRVPVAAAAAATAAVVASSMVVAAAKAELVSDPNLDVPVAAAATATAAVVVATSAVVARKIPLPDLSKDSDSEKGGSGNNLDKYTEDYKDGETHSQSLGFADERVSEKSVSSSSGTPEQVLEDVAECEIFWEELEIGDRIGLGSYGEVYRAEWHGTEVAVKKFIEQDISGDALEEFASEVRLMKRLRHPNVVLFMGAVMRPPNLSIVTEFLPRGSLYRLIHRSNSVIDERRRMRMAMDIARGMNYLHNSSPVIVHRDLKSPNLLVDRNWVVKVCDFGLSRLKHNTFLSSKSTAGTPEWMAPEVLRNEPSNEKADVYSFGVILWELVTLQQPWAGLMPMQVVGAVGYQFRTLDIPDYVDPGLAEIIHQCWRREPAERPSFSELLAALKPLQKLPCRQTATS